MPADDNVISSVIGQGPPPTTTYSGPMKIPDFSPVNVARWFRILEAQFKIRNITHGATQFAHAISAVPMEFQIEVPLATLDAEDYTAFKAVLIDRHEKSKDEIFEDMVARKQIDDRKPSLYLHEIHRAAQQLGLPDDMVRRIFFQSLDPSIVPVVAMNDDMDITKLGKLADKVAPLGRRGSPAYTVNLLNSNEERGRQQQRPAQYKAPPRQPTPGASNSKSFDLTPFASGQRPKICRYHLFYGRDAKTCTEWCHWPNKGKVNLAGKNRSQSRGGQGRRPSSPHPNKDKAKPPPKQLAIKGPHSDSDLSDSENS